MATFTTNLNLRKPADADQVDVDLDLGANFDILDDAITNSTKPLLYRKSATTNKVNNAVLGADPHLQAPVLAATKYKITLGLRFSLNDNVGGDNLNGGGVQVALNIPGAGTALLLSSTVSLVDEAAFVLEGALGGFAPATRNFILTGWVIPGSDGTLTLDWAQAVSHADSVDLLINSFMFIQKFGN